MKRITLRDIGEKLGLSHVTIFKALRDDPSLPEATKEKVRKMAAELGYRPDPVLGALNAYRRANRTVSYQSTLAWINPYPKSEGQRLDAIHDGAAKRALELGFLLEPFWVLTADDWKRLAKTLRSRGIQGLVMTSVPFFLYPALNPNDPQTWPWREFPWNDFSVIAVGQNTGPMFHIVASNQVQCAALVVANLVKLGYRKIGIVLHSIQERTVDYNWLAGYLAECARQRITPLYMEDPEPVGPLLTVGPNFTKHAAQWILRHRPDAIIAPAKGEINAMLERAKLTVPADIAVAVLSARNYMEVPTHAGIYQNFWGIGEATVNQLVDLIRRNERGIPTSPMRYLVEGAWIDGPSAPAFQQR